MARKILRTKLCDLLEIEYPVLLAGMYGVANAELVAAVSNAGGLGVIGGTLFTPDELREEIRKVKRLTNKPFGVDLLLPTMEEIPRPVPSPAPSPTPSAPSPTPTISQIKKLLPTPQVEFVERLKRELGVPQVEPSLKATLAPESIRKSIQILYEEKVPVFASGLGSPGWMVPEAHAHGMKVIGLVGNVRNARRVAETGVDIIIAQGHEAGGHTGRIGTLALVPQVVDAVYPTPVVAAGGIGDGRGLAAALALGACGVWVGTAFIATYESAEHDFQKKKILAATEEDTRVTRIYSGKTTRCINNKLIEIWEKEGVPTLPMPLQPILIADLQEGLLQTGMTDYLSGFAGQIAGMVREMKSAQQVLNEMVEGAIRVLKERLPREVIAEG